MKKINWENVEDSINEVLYELIDLSARIVYLRTGVACPGWEATMPVRELVEPLTEESLRKSLDYMSSYIKKAWDVRHDPMVRVRIGLGG